MAAPRGFRWQVCLTLVAGLAVAASWNFFQVAFALSEQEQDPYGVAAAIRRFDQVLPLIPPNERVGYISNLTSNPNLGTMTFLSAQYAMAPHLLIPAEGSQAPVEWAVGNFSDPLDYAAIGASHGYTLVRDFGRGLVLFRRRQ